MPSPTVGADIEWIEPRAANFVADFFSADEIDRLAKADPAHRDRLVTAIWSAKEAALKTVQLGLRADTRCITCAPGAAQGDEWATVAIRLSGALRRSPAVAGHRFTGWWRTFTSGAGEHFVLTLVSRERAM